jgi:hypothetical protein
MDLLKQQEELQKEAHQLLDETGILEFLSKFGEIEIGGSLDSGLMVWRDIDLGVIAKVLDEDKYWGIVQFLFGLNNYYHSLYIQDFRESVNPNSPKGLYVGLKIKFREKIWKVDVWYVEPRKETETNYNEWLKEQLNDENRKIILEIKSKVFEHPKYRKEISAVDIYDSVINEGIKNLEDFRIYIQEKKKIVL